MSSKKLSNSELHQSFTLVKHGKTTDTIRTVFRAGVVWSIRSRAYFTPQSSFREEVKSLSVPRQRDLQSVLNRRYWVWETLVWHGSGLGCSSFGMTAGPVNVWFLVLVALNLFSTCIDSPALFPCFLFSVHIRSNITVFVPCHNCQMDGFL